MMKTSVLNIFYKNVSSLMTLKTYFYNLIGTKFLINSNAYERCQKWGHVNSTILDLPENILVLLLSNFINSNFKAQLAIL